jgi:hypothetical protein
MRILIDGEQGAETLTHRMRSHVHPFTHLPLCLPCLSCGVVQGEGQNYIAIINPPDTTP